MTQGTAHCVGSEESATIIYRTCTDIPVRVDGCRGRQIGHENGEVHHIAGKSLWRGRLKVLVVFGHWIKEAARGLVPLLLKQFIADALLDVVRLGPKNHQRLILSLPTKT